MSRGTESLNWQFFFFFYVWWEEFHAERESHYTRWNIRDAPLFISNGKITAINSSAICARAKSFFLFGYLCCEMISVDQLNNVTLGKIEKEKKKNFFIDWISFLVPCWHSQNWNNLVSFCPFVEFPAVYIPLVSLVVFFWIIITPGLRLKIDRQKERKNAEMFVHHKVFITTSIEIVYMRKNSIVRGSTVTKKNN